MPVKLLYKIEYRFPGRKVTASDVKVFKPSSIAVADTVPSGQKMVCLSFGYPFRHRKAMASKQIVTNSTEQKYAAFVFECGIFF